MPVLRCREYDDLGNPIRGGCRRQGTGCEFVHPSEPHWARASRKEPVTRGDLGGVGRGRGTAPERGRGRGGPPTGPRQGNKKFSSVARGASTSSTPDAGPSTSWGAGGSWGGEDDVTGGESWTNWGRSSMLHSLNGSWGSTSNSWPTKWGDDNDDVGSSSKEAGKEGKGKGKEKETTWGSCGGWGASSENWGNPGSGWGSVDADSWNTTGEGLGTVASNSSTNAPTLNWGDTNWGDNKFTDEPAKDTTASSTLASNNDTPLPTELGKGKWKAVSGSSKPSTLSSVPARRPSRDSTPNEREMKRLCVDGHAESTTQDAEPMDVDTPRSVTAPVSAVAHINAKLESPAPIYSATRPKGSPYRAGEQRILPAVVPTSRSTSMAPVDVRGSKALRSLKSVSYEQSRHFWSKYVESISELIRLREQMNDADEHLRDYRVAQNSNLYVKTGSRGMNLLDEESIYLKSCASKCREAYMDALTKLCAFEEGFDFPMHVLTARKLDEKRMKEEIARIEKYAQDVKIYVDLTRSEVDEIDARARCPPEPQPVSPAAGVNAENKGTNTFASLKAKKTAEKVVMLEEKSADFEQVIEDFKNGANISDVVQNKLEDFKMSFQGLLDMERDDEQDELSEKFAKLGNDQSTIGTELQNLGNEVGELFTVFKDLETRVMARRDTEYLNAQDLLLDRNKLELSAGQAHENDSRALLAESTANLERLRAELHAIQDTTSAPSPLQDGITEEVISQLFAKLLPHIQERTSVETITALESMKTELAEIIDEHSKNKVGELFALLSPMYRAVFEMQTKLERKGVLTRSRPASPHIGDVRLAVVAHTTHT